MLKNQYSLGLWWLVNFVVILVNSFKSALLVL